WLGRPNMPPDGLPLLADAICSASLAEIAIGSWLEQSVDSPDDCDNNGYRNDEQTQHQQQSRSVHLPIRVKGRVLPGSLNVYNSQGTCKAECRAYDNTPEWSAQFHDARRAESCA